MGTRISPERSRELREGAQRGPWKAVDEDDNGKKRPDTSRLMRSASGEYLGIMHGQDAHLAAAAPDLAETIAGMTYEYTVYVYLGERHIIQWSFEEDSHVGEWTGERDTAEYVRDALINEGRQARLVRRLVTAPEVIE